MNSAHNNGLVIMFLDEGVHHLNVELNEYVQIVLSDVEFGWLCTVQAFHVMGLNQLNESVADV